MPRQQQRQQKKLLSKMVVDEEQLIRLVAARPILYDKSLKAHRKTGIRQQVWKEVGDEIGGVTVDECRRRWRSLRDSFTKHYKKSTKLGAEKQYNKSKKWIFYDQMSFMEPYLKKASFNFDQNRLDCFPDNSNSDEADDIECESNIIKFDVIKHNVSEEEHDDCETVDADVRTLQRKHVTRLQDCATHDRPTSSSALSEQHEQGELINVCLSNGKTLKGITNDNQANSRDVSQTFEEVQYTSIATDDDADNNEKFLLSCLPILKRLSHQKNSLARLRIQKVLYEIEFGEL